MRKRSLIILVLFLLCDGCVSIRPQLRNQNLHEEFGTFKKNERILILAPHPDDEAIACAGVIQKALKAGARVRVVYLTNGDHNEFAFIVYERRITLRQGEFIYLGKVRQAEAVKAMKFLGLSEKDLVFLGYPDYGTFEIFSKYWQEGKPFRDRLTRISSVPYKEDPSYGLEYVGQNIVTDISRQILDYQPDKIFVSHPADVNVDHKTLYLFLQIALSDLEGRIAKPEIYPYLVHCVDWPKPRFYHPELELRPPDKFKNSQIHWPHLDLTPAQVDKKYRTILFYKSQTASSAFYLLSFARKNELFSDYPDLELKPQTSLVGKGLAYSDASTISREESYPAGTKSQPSQDKGTVGYAAESDNFIVHLDKPKRLSMRFGALLYIFGYRQGTPFAQMPKIRIIIIGKSCKVFSSKTRLTAAQVRVDADSSSLTIKIPLKLLGYPDYALTALKAYHGTVPLDLVVFRKVKFK
jgi:LmbE family N-acetylglucosaminyl deacetylase